jgi:hypothetical protein
MDGVYRIRKALVIPLVLNAVLVFFLLLLSLFRKGSAMEAVVLTFILVPLALIVLECFFREVTISAEGLMMKKLLRRKILGWGEITDVGTMILRKKVYLVLTTTRGFHIISNAYENFAALVQGMVRHMEPERIEETVKTLVENPVRRMSDVVSAWVGVGVLLVVLYVKIIL